MLNISSHLERPEDYHTLELPVLSLMNRERDSPPLSVGTEGSSPPDNLLDLGANLLRPYDFPAMDEALPAHPIDDLPHPCSTGTI